MTDPAPRVVAVVGGGRSDEHDVSLASAASAAASLRASGSTVVALTVDRDGGWRRTGGGPLTAAEAVGLLTGCDAAFPLLHGVDGEDGAVAGLLRMVGVPVVGSPVRAGALATDKWATKLVAAAVGVRTAPGVLVGPGEPVPGDAPAPPVVVKPTSGGSSDGVSLVDDDAGLPAALDRARAAGDAVLVEAFVPGREVDLALFRDRHGVLRAGAALEIGVPELGVFDRDSKYDGTAAFTVPARLLPDELAAVDRAARLLYEALGCSGVARFDFFVTAEGVVLNEVNTCPGFTERSQVPLMYAAVGLDHEGLVAALVAAALAEAARDDGTHARRAATRPPAARR